MLENVKVSKKEMDRETLINVARTSLCTKVTKQVASVLTEVTLSLPLSLSLLSALFSPLPPSLHLSLPYYDHFLTCLQVVVDAVLAIRKSEGEPIDLHMVEIMEMMHRTDTDTKYVHSMHQSVVNVVSVVNVLFIKYKKQLNKIEG